MSSFSFSLYSAHWGRMVELNFVLLSSILIKITDIFNKPNWIVHYPANKHWVRWNDIVYSQMMSREQTLSSSRFKSVIQLDKNPKCMPCWGYSRKPTVLWMLTQWGTSIGCWKSESLRLARRQRRQSARWCCLFSITTIPAFIHTHTHTHTHTQLFVHSRSTIFWQ